jgi:hypothetical protein
MEETCAGCGHTLGLHFQDVTGKARCLHVEHGESSGVCMPYHQQCDCVDYKSQRAERRKQNPVVFPWQQE